MAISDLELGHSMPASGTSICDAAGPMQKSGMNISLRGSLVVVLLSARLGWGWAAQTAAPTVDAPALMAFMEKWKAYEPFKIPLALPHGPRRLALPGG